MINDKVVAFVIHSRNYKNTSQLVDFLTDDLGLIRLVVNGVKSQQMKIQPFVKLQINFSGKGELKTLRNWEIIDKPRCLSGKKLLLAVYINELIAKLAMTDTVKLCDDYLYFLLNLTDDDANNEWQLRIFENQLLVQIGYGMDFAKDISGSSIIADNKYSFELNKGFILNKNGNIDGNILLKIAKNQMPKKSDLIICKNINRLRIKELLAGKELNSRKLFNKKYK